MNRKYDYAVLEREYVTGTMSLRELCRSHGISNHSVVMERSKKDKWGEKRETYKGRVADRAMTYTADQEAMRIAREAEVRDNAIDAIDEAISKMRSDMQRTEKKLVDNEWVDVPAMTIRPQDIALLIDRLQVLWGKPATISEERTLGVNITGSAEPDILRGIVEATRGVVHRDAARSPIPRAPRAREG